MEKPGNGGAKTLDLIQEHPHQTPEDKVILELITYDREHFAKHENLPVDELLKQIDPAQINWINLDGLNDPQIIEKLQSHFGLHNLLIEDLFNDQRPKAEEFDEYLFVSLKMLYRIDGYQIDYEQISFVLGSYYLITFQEKEGDIFDSFRERIRLDQGRVRKKRADYLLYRLIDIIVDKYYTILETIGEQIEEIEESIYKEPSEQNFLKIQALKKELIYLRKSVYPLRDVVSLLLKNEYGFIEEENHHFYSDIYSHVIHLIDSLDMYNDLVSSLTDSHINSLNTRLNEVIRVLTVISTIFMPLNFLAGLYGMNFSSMPPFNWEYGWVIIWSIMIVSVILMLRYFKRKQWI